MIEIIREENWDDTKEKKLPKDIRQIGRPDVGERIYIEDEVYQYLHPYENASEKLAYVLLGRFENYNGRQCTFVEAAIQLEQIEFEGEIPRWSDHEWAYIYKRLKDEYDSMVIVGWALDLRGCLPNMTKQIEQFHQTHFGGIHQTLFLMDTLEREETFFSARSGHLYRREGFYIYYDRQAATRAVERSIETVDREKQGEPQEIHSAETDETHFMQQDEPVYSKENPNDILEEELYIEESMQQKEPELSSQTGQKRQGRYRKQLEAAEKTEETKIPAYSSIALAVVVLTLGFTAYQNHRKMNEMQDALAQMNQVHIVTETQETEKQADTKTSNAGIVVENVAGTVERQPAADQPETTETQIQAGQPETTETQVQAGQDETNGIQSVEEQSKTSETPETAETAEPQSEKEEQKPETVNTAAQADEAQTYLNQGYYVVQQGDNLAAICRKIYKTTAMMDKVCEANGIDDPDAIYAGQYLTLPN